MLRHYVETVLPNGLQGPGRGAQPPRRRSATGTPSCSARDELVAEIEALPEATRERQPGRADGPPHRLPGPRLQAPGPAAGDRLRPGHLGHPERREALRGLDRPRQQDAAPRLHAPFPAGPDRTRARVPAGEVDAAHRVRRPRRAGALPGPAHAGRGAAAGHRARQPARRQARTAATSSTTWASPATSRRRSRSTPPRTSRAALTDLSTQVAALDDRAARVVMVFTDSGVTPARATRPWRTASCSWPTGELRDRFETELEPVPGHRRHGAADAGGAAVPPRRASYSPRSPRAPGADTGMAATSTHRLYGAKVRELIDEHMVALGVDRVLPPVSITDPEYQAKVAASAVRAPARRRWSTRSGTTSACTSDEDPTRYRRLSERLEQILAEHAGNWEQQALSLGALLAEMQSRRCGRRRRTRRLSRPQPAGVGALRPAGRGDRDRRHFGRAPRVRRLADFCRRLHELAARQTTRMDFWRHDVDQYAFRDEITVALIEDGIGDRTGPRAGRQALRDHQGQQESHQSPRISWEFMELASRVLGRCRASWGAATLRSQGGFPQIDARSPWRPGRARHGQRPAADRRAHRRARRHGHGRRPAGDRRGGPGPHRTAKRPGCTPSSASAPRRASRGHPGSSSAARVSPTWAAAIGCCWSMSRQASVRLVEGPAATCAATALADATAHLVRWYRAVGEPWLRQRIAPWAQRMGIEVAALRVQPLGYRWGSCTAKARSTSTGPRCSCRPDLIDYVLVHELAHVRHPDHGTEFWRTVDRAMPGYEVRRARLKQVGPNLWIP